MASCQLQKPAEQTCNQKSHEHTSGQKITEMTHRVFKSCSEYNFTKVTRDRKVATLWWHARASAVAKHMLTTQTKGFLKRRLTAMGIPMWPRLNLTAQAKHKATMLSNRQHISGLPKEERKVLKRKDCGCGDKKSSSSSSDSETENDDCRKKN